MPFSFLLSRPLWGFVFADFHLGLIRCLFDLTEMETDDSKANSERYKRNLEVPLKLYISLYMIIAIERSDDYFRVLTKLE